MTLIFWMCYCCQLLALPCCKYSFESTHRMAAMFFRETTHWCWLTILNFVPPKWSQKHTDQGWYEIFLHHHIFIRMGSTDVANWKSSKIMDFVNITISNILHIYVMMYCQSFSQVHDNLGQTWMSCFLARRVSPKAINQYNSKVGFLCQK